MLFRCYRSFQILRAFKMHRRAALEQPTVPIVIIKIRWKRSNVCTPKTSNIEPHINLKPSSLTRNLPPTHAHSCSPRWTGSRPPRAWWSSPPPMWWRRWTPPSSARGGSTDRRVSFDPSRRPLSVLNFYFFTRDLHACMHTHVDIVPIFIASYCFFSCGFVPVVAKSIT